MADEAVNPVSTNPFKGNLDPGKLRDCIARHGAGKIPFVRMEASTNLIGGQPFSIANMREIRGICDEFGIMLVLDASLIGENAYFIKMREDEFRDASCADILKTMCGLADLVYFPPARFPPPAAAASARTTGPLPRKWSISFPSLKDFDLWRHLRAGN